MNINAKELLLFNKKIRFGEGTNSAATNPEAAAVKPDTLGPQTGLNALMFQGMQNVVSDPQLSTNLGMVNEVAPQKEPQGDSKEYVAPYKSNIAFQGLNGNKIKSVALAALMGLATLGATSSLTSCVDISQEVTVDLNAISKMLSQMTEILNQIKDQNAENNEQIKQMNAYMLQLIEEVKNGNMSANDFYKKMFEYMVVNQTNQEIIIDQLVQNGNTQEEANKLIQQLINDVNKGIISAEEAWNKIQELLGDIKGLLSQALADFNKYYEQMLAKQDELIQTNKEGFEELIETGKISNDKLDSLRAQNDSLIVLSNKQLEAQKDIKEAIEKANIDNNANFETVVNTLNANKDEMIDVLVKLGYRQEEVIKMTAGEIKAAIDYNTAITKQGNELLSKITNYVAVLPQMLEENKLTNAQLKEIYELFSEAVAADGEYSEEMLSKLEEVVGKLDSIEGILEDMNAKLTTIINEFQAFRTEYTNDKKEEFKKLDQLVQDNRFQTAILNEMKEAQKGMAENLEGLKANSDTLLVIAKDDTRHKELIEAIKNIQSGEGGSGSIDYDKLEAMFEAMGIKIADAIKMSSSELEQAIKEFQNTYIKNESEQTELMASINKKLEDISNFQGLNKDEIINAINNVTEAVNNNSENIVDEIKNLEAQIEKLQATVDAMFKAFGEYAAKVDQYFSMFDAKFDAVLNSLDKIDTDMNTIISNQTIANKYLQNLNSSIEDIKTQINEIKVIIEGNEGGSGSGITLEQLEKLLKERDEANYEKYKELLENLNIKVDVDTSSIEDLLKEIDEKMNLLNENNRLLGEILDFLKGIDWSHPDYSGKLDEIIEILKTFDKNCCDCNEGILGDLEDALG